MAKKRSRRKTAIKLFSLPFLGGLLVILVFLAAVTWGYSTKSVKGTADFKLASGSSDATSNGKLKYCFKNSRITSFVLSGVCENREKDGFTIASYSCQDGTSGTIQKGCKGGLALLNEARLNCIRTVCPIVTLPPRPGGSSTNSTGNTQNGSQR